ncbi:MAG: ABC transporter ATP-binding protein [Gammaproteobacteria bacterium]|nr:MAG: ABC transporter ATP-binding protein [Gammaproteobacteria bacterium]
MIKLENVVLQRGKKPLLENASLVVQKTWKVGLVGNNGSGKSSLFALLLNKVTQESGICTLPKHWAIAHLKQETPAHQQNCIEFVIDGDAELRLVEAQLAQAEQQHDAQKISQLHEKLDNIDGYTANTRAAKLLHGLGFQQEDHHRTVAEFSGGWRMRLNLAQTLMQRSDLLLLDEPTNHLDLDAIFWLEQWLKRYPGTLILISHDREFLDNVVTHIIHICQLDAQIYPGNYSSFEIQRAEKLALESKVYEKQQTKIKHLQSFVDRFGAKASKAKQSQSRLKSIQKLSSSAPAHIDSPFQFEFPAPESLASPLIKLDQAQLGYDQQSIVRTERLQIDIETRIAILGPNGCGKSTLLKSLMGELSLQQGERWINQNCKIGYFSQHQVDALDLNATPLQTFIRLSPRSTELALRKFLGGFDFQGDQVNEPTKNFSGGEKARLTLALIVFQKPNCLILDEPTNHLDLEMRHALTVALQGFEGAIILVSHDRHLLQCVTSEFVLIADQQLAPFDGDLNDYKRWLDEKNKTEQSGETAGQNTDPSNNLKPDRKEKRRLAAQARAISQPLTKKLRTLEKKLAQLQAKHSDLEIKLADPELYNEASKQTLLSYQQDLGKTAVTIEQIEDQWFTLSEEIEALENHDDLSE